MDTEQWRSAFHRDVDRLASAVEGSLDRQVPTCPDWKVRDLAHHVVAVLHFWTDAAAERIADAESWMPPPEAADADLPSALRSIGREAEAAIYSLDPAAPRWSWSIHRHAGFIQRRVAHETAIHLQDALLATTGAEPVDRTLAVDGVSELLDTFWATDPEWLAKAPPIDLQAVDTDDRWRIGPEDGLPEVSIEATASDLFLLLWRRPTSRTPVIDGDEAVWDDFYEAIAIR